MWKELIDYARRLFSLQARVDGLAEDVKEIRQELRALSDLVREYRSEQEKDRAVAERDRGILFLRL